MNNWTKMHGKRIRGTTVCSTQLYFRHWDSFSTNSKKHHCSKSHPLFQPLGNETYYFLPVTPVYIYLSFRCPWSSLNTLRLLWHRIKMPLLPFHQCYRCPANALISRLCDFLCFSNFSCRWIPTRDSCPAKSWGTPATVHVSCQMVCCDTLCSHNRS